MEPGAKCYMCKEWQEDRCRTYMGRCGFREASIVDAATLDGGAAPAWIEVWMSADADASDCGGLELTTVGRRELELRRAEDVHPMPQGPADPAEWSRKAVGV